MLAESRRRRKNPMHSINLSAPNHWTNDESKFGQKMLEKMGWTKGSGLGKNNQGIAENIRVQHKVTPTGLGFVAHDADDWFKAGKDYARLLSQLAENFNSELLSEYDVNNKKSLVENSFKSRSRVHYHKFTRGKDLTRYKNEELACILGKDKKEEQKSNSLDMKEYFKIKKKSKSLIGNEKCDNKILETDTVIEVTDEKMNEYDNYDGRKNKKKKHKIIHENSVLNDQETPPCNKKPKLEQTTTIQSEEQLINETNLTVCKKNKSYKKKNENKSFKELLVNEHDCKNNTEYQDNYESEENKNNSNNSSSNLNKETTSSDQVKKKNKSKLKNETSVETKINAEFEVTDHSKVRGDSDDHSNNNKESLINNPDNNSREDKKNLSKTVFTHKYQILVDLMIENSSAGKLFCKDTPLPEYYEKVEHFIEKVKKEPGSTITPVEKEVNSSKSKLLKGELKNLNPDNKNFINDFEAQKSKLLREKMTLHPTPKSVNNKTMFVAKYGDILFFGSNINEIKGYGEY